MAIGRQFAYVLILLLFSGSAIRQCRNPQKEHLLVLGGEKGSGTIRFPCHGHD